MNKNIQGAFQICISVPLSISEHFKQFQFRKSSQSTKKLGQHFLINSQLTHTAQKMKFSIKDFFSKYDKIRRKLRIWSHLLKILNGKLHFLCSVRIFFRFTGLCLSTFVAILFRTTNSRTIPINRTWHCICYLKCERKFQKV